MSGHSKWHNIQKKKGAVDSKRASAFTKLAKTITVAAKQGGGDPSFNFALRVAIDNAKAANMPKDKIEKAVERGSGAGGEAELEEVMYEGFAPGGVAMMVKCLTDNRNRTVADVKTIVAKNGGTIGVSGSVMWMFEKKGVVAVSDISAIADRDAFELAVIDAGASDIVWEEEGVRVFCEFTDLKAVLEAVEKQGAHVDGAGVDYLAKQTVSVEDETAKDQMEKLLEALDEYDDVDEVFTNEA